MSLSEHYANKEAVYFAQAHYEVADLIKGHGQRVLEIGCAEGHTGAMLKRLDKASEVHGVELLDEIAERARLRLDSVTIGNLETIEFPFEPGYFDCVVATEVLEHLIDPERLLQRLMPLLRPGGYIIASTPNIRHVRVLWSLVVMGDWRYEDDGPLDRTHMRFFTKRSLVRLFAEAGYVVEMVRPVFLSKAAPISKITVGVFEEFLAYRYYCRACRSEAS